MTRSAKAWLCAAIALVAAAIADPIVEAISNAGVFGPGPFTDRSTADVIPTLVAGGLVVVVQLVVRLWTRRDGRALKCGLARLLPAAFILQIAILFVMENCEQLAIYHHVLGSTIWLGGPIAFSLGVHAAVCAAVAVALVRAVSLLTRAVAGIWRVIRALATVSPQRSFAARRRYRRAPRPAVPLLCRIGVRGPPALPGAGPISHAFGEYSCFLKPRLASLSSPL